MALPRASSTTTGDQPSELVKEISGIPEGYPATDLVKYLLKNIALDISKFRRHIQSSFAIVRRSRNVYDALQPLMSSVQTAQTSDWRGFDKYTAAIGPLEELLLGLTITPGDDPPGNLPPETDIASCITFIERWATDRGAIVSTLKKFGSDHLKTLSEHPRGNLGVAIEEALRIDDVAALNALCSYIKKQALMDHYMSPSTNPRDVSDVRELVASIQIKLIGEAKPHPDDSMEISIRSIMLVCTPFAVIGNPQTKSEWVEHLTAANIWVEMKSFLEALDQHLRHGKYSIPQLKEKYRVLEELLSRPLSSELLDLMRLAGRVRRPFHGRAVRIVHMWQYLTANSDMRADRDIARRSELQRDIKRAVSVFQEASKAVADLTILTLKSPQSMKMDKDFGDLVENLEKHFKTYTADGLWEEYKNTFEEAKKTDIEHFTGVKTRLNINE